MAKALRSVADLRAAGLAPSDPRLDEVAARFQLAITPAMVRLIDPDDPADPIARQFVPSSAELDTSVEERADPIGDGVHEKTPGLIHRYSDRVLLKLTQICPVYCRFCFRREMVGPDHSGMDEAAIAQALAYIEARSEIWEVILTGGDPLILSARRLAEVLRGLDRIAHLGVLRIHSRVPVVAPERITDALVAALRGRLPVFLVLHANHADELTQDARAAIARLVDAGIPMLAQSVLLHGVNDAPEALTALMRRLVEARVKPYYLHHGDLAPGTGHFRTSIAAGQALMRDLRGRVSGLCQPSYMLDIPGGFGKVPIGPCYLTPDGADGWQVRDPDGRDHAYREIIPPR